MEELGRDAPEQDAPYSTEIATANHDELRAWWLASSREKGVGGVTHCDDRVNGSAGKPVQCSGELLELPPVKFVFVVRAQIPIFTG